jgi:hypothetical protein
MYPPENPIPTMMSKRLKALETVKMIHHRCCFELLKKAKVVARKKIPEKKTPKGRCHVRYHTRKSNQPKFWTAWRSQKY